MPVWLWGLLWSFTILVAFVCGTAWAGLRSGDE